MGRDIDQAKAIINGLDEEIIKILSSGIAVSSFDIVTEIFKTLNPNQNAIPFYSFDLKSKIVDTGKCEDKFTKFTPFTNVFGRDAHELIAVAYIRSVILGDRSAVVANNAIFFNTAGVVKASELQQNLIGRLLDYRANPAEAVPAACLEAVNVWARDILLNDTRFAAQRVSLAQNATLERMVSLLMNDAKKVMAALGSVHGLILGTPSSDFNNASHLLLQIADRLADAAIKQRIFNLISNEVENLISVQKELSVANGFQNEFNNSLTMFRESMASFKAGQADLTAKLQTEVASRQAADGVQAAQMAQTKGALGYLAALAQTDSLASKELRVKVAGAAVVDQSIKDLIENINKSGRNKTEEPFSPKILAIRHTVTGNVACFGKEGSAEQLPSSDAFVGGWGVNLSSNCYVNFRSGSQHKDNVIYRTWGSAHKISFRSTINNQTTVVDFREPAQTAPLRKVVGGGFASGVFDAQIPGLLDPVVARGWAYCDGIVAMTPIYVSQSGFEARGPEQVYNMTLYSPLIFDFNSHGIPKTMSSSDSGVQFDITASGIKMNVGWVSGREGALLALDLDHNGRIDSGAELFGEFTKIGATGENAKNGYAALAQYDLNHDGRIDENDPVFSQLKLWFDDNSNGVVDAGELKNLVEMQISRIDLKYKEVPKNLQVQSGNRILTTARFYGPKQCGIKGCKSYDVYFGTAWMEKIPSYLSRR